MGTTGNQSILIVDDEAIIRDFLSEVLEDYDVAVACDGDEAIAKLKERSFDLIITDLRMPKVPGQEVVKAARELRPDAKVVVISGYSSLHTVSQSVTHGACAFLSKPFSIKELMQTVTTALEGDGDNHG
jgi:DNA-binding NtrC family response regulator